jgi:hypothetical protein
MPTNNKGHKRECKTRRIRPLGQTWTKKRSAHRQKAASKIRIEKAMKALITEFFPSGSINDMVHHSIKKKKIMTIKHIIRAANFSIFSSLKAHKRWNLHYLQAIF